MTKLTIKKTDVILKRAKDYYEHDKKRLKEQARDKYRNLSDKKIKIKRENMEEIDTVIYLRGETKTKRIPKKLPRVQKIKIKKFYFFSFHFIKHGTKSYLSRRKWDHKKGFS